MCPAVRGQGHLRAFLQGIKGVELQLLAVQLGAVLCLALKQKQLFIRGYKAGVVARHEVEGLGDMDVFLWPLGDPRVCFCASVSSTSNGFIESGSKETQSTSPLRVQSFRLEKSVKEHRPLVCEIAELAGTVEGVVLSASPVVGDIVRRLKICRACRCRCGVCLLLSER